MLLFTKMPTMIRPKNDYRVRIIFARFKRIQHTTQLFISIADAGQVRLHGAQFGSLFFDLFQVRPTRRSEAFTRLGYILQIFLPILRGDHVD